MSINVRSLIQDSADIITVVHLKPGDVYTRLETDGADYAQMLYGVVSAVYNNGTDTVITSIEYGKQRYSGGFSANTNVFRGNESPPIFEANPDEFKVYLSEMQRSAQYEVELKQRELLQSEEKLRTIIKLSERKELTKAETIKGIEPIDDF